MAGRQVAPDEANICYGILSCYKQVAPTELIGNMFFKRLKCYEKIKVEHIMDEKHRQARKLTSRAKVDGIKITYPPESVQISHEIKDE